MSDEPLLRLLEKLNDIRLRYMLTGSYASNIYGRVRSTFDADFVVALDANQFRKLSEALSPEYYLDSTTLEEIQESGGQFNAIHKKSGLKADFYLLGPGDYPHTAFQRRKRRKLGALTVWVISPEDLILAKLRWAKQGGSARQLEDARGIYDVQRGALDENYLRRWARETEVDEQLREIEEGP